MFSKHTTLVEVVMVKPDPVVTTWSQMPPFCCHLKRGKNGTHFLPACRKEREHSPGPTADWTHSQRAPKESANPVSALTAPDREGDEPVRAWGWDWEGEVTDVLMDGLRTVCVWEDENPFYALLIITTYLDGNALSHLLLLCRSHLVNPMWMFRSNPLPFLFSFSFNCYQNCGFSSDEHNTRLP